MSAPGGRFELLGVAALHLVRQRQQQSPRVLSRWLFKPLCPRPAAAAAQLPHGGRDEPTVAAILAGTWRRVAHRPLVSPSSTFEDAPMRTEAAAPIKRATARTRIRDFLSGQVRLWERALDDLEPWRQEGPLRWSGNRLDGCLQTEAHTRSVH